MRNLIAAVLLALVFAGCSTASAPARQEHVRAQPAATQVPEHQRLLVINQSLPTVQSFREFEGQRINVLPAGAFTPATIAAPIRATLVGSLTGDVIVEPSGKLWAANNSNTPTQIIQLLGVAGKPGNGWSRLPVKINRAVIKRPDGTTLTIPVDADLVDSDDEMSDVRCTFDSATMVNGRAEPTVAVAKGHGVVVMMNESADLP